MSEHEQTLRRMEPQPACRAQGGDRWTANPKGRGDEAVGGCGDEPVPTPIPRAQPSRPRKLDGISPSSPAGQPGCARGRALSGLARQPWVGWWGGKATDNVGTWANATPGGAPTGMPGTGGRSLDGKPEGPGGTRRWADVGTSRPHPNPPGAAPRLTAGSGPPRRPRGCRAISLSRFPSPSPSQPPRRRPTGRWRRRDICRPATTQCPMGACPP